MPTSSPFYDAQPGPEIREKLNEMYATWLAALETAVGKDGWSPLLRVVADGQRQVIQLYDWIGGTTAKPATGFMGPLGLVATAAEAVNFRGANGTDGSNGTDGTDGTNGTDGTDGDNGWSPILRSVADGPRQVIELYDWIGGEGAKPTQTGFMGPGGLVTTAAAGYDFRGETGETPTVEVGLVSTGAPGTNVIITPRGTPTALILDFTIPRGADGSGAGDVVGPAGVQDLQLAQFDGPTGKLVRALNLSGMLKLDEGRPFAAVAGTDYVLPSGKVKALSSQPLPPGADITALPPGNYYTPDGFNFAGLQNYFTNTGFGASITVSDGGPLGSYREFRAVHVDDSLRAIHAVMVGNAGDFTPWAVAYSTSTPPTKTVIGLSNVDNTSDVAKPVSTAQQTALNAKQDTLVSGTNIKTVNGNPLPGSGDVNVQWKAVDIPSAANLDTYQTEGVFVAPTTLIAASLSNSPTAVAFSLRVWKTAGVIQEVTEFQTNNTRKTYQRSFALGVWGTWARFYTTIDVPSKTAIGLGNVDNTSDADKPVSTAQQTAIDTKQNTLVSGENIKTINGEALTGSGNLVVGQEAGVLPQNSQSAAYTLTLADMGKHLLHPAADTTARTFTIPANAAVAFPIGAAITFVNQNGTGGVVTIAITTDVMRLAGAGTTGSRTLARNGIATALKIAATEWIISGSGLT